MRSQEFTQSPIRIQRMNYVQAKPIIQRLNRRLFADEMIDTSKDSQAVWWIAMAGDRVAGYAALLPRGQDGYLLRAGVSPRFRGQGLQKQLIQTRENYARKIGLKRLVTDTHKSNEASIRSLERQGFKPYREKDPWMPTSWVRQSIFWQKPLI